MTPKSLITFFTSGWSGATPKRTRPKGVGKRSNMSIFRVSPAYLLASLANINHQSPALCFFTKMLGSCHCIVLIQGSGPSQDVFLETNSIRWLCENRVEGRNTWP